MPVEASCDQQTSAYPEHCASQALQRSAGAIGKNGVGSWSPTPCLSIPRESPAPQGLLGGYTLEAASPDSPSSLKVISLKEGDFFFDSLRQVSDWVKKNRPQKEGEGASLWRGVAACLLSHWYGSRPRHPFSLPCSPGHAKASFRQGERGSPGSTSWRGGGSRDISGGSSYTA